ncbi:MAG: helix-turn-helix transcriptional regulator [Paludibacteraceae bacterium]|nr:helix-turn-helix transcriptional regulator [Paludibacteraceae bacterium]
MLQNPNLTDYSAVLAEKYGEVGTPEREENNNLARSYYMGIVLQDARKEEHLTQAELAKRIGANKSYISRIENGLIDPTVSSFLKIVHALGLRVELTRPLN